MFENKYDSKMLPSSVLKYPLNTPADISRICTSLILVFILFSRADHFILRSGCGYLAKIASSNSSLT